MLDWPEACGFFQVNQRKKYLKFKIWWIKMDEVPRKRGGPYEFSSFDPDH